MHIVIYDAFILFLYCFLLSFNLVLILMCKTASGDKDALARGKTD